MEHISLLVIRSGINNYFRAKGKFEVLFTNGVKNFDKLSDAVKFYNELHTESSIWDITVKAKLLEAKVELDKNKLEGFEPVISLNKKIYEASVEDIKV